MKLPASRHPAIAGDKILARMSRMGISGRHPFASSYEVGDDVFFTHQNGPQSGRVIASGRHGCTVCDSSGGQHRVKWADMLGLKGRKTFAARVVDRGTGGAIMEREDGSRFYVSGAIPDWQEADILSPDDPFEQEMLTKADAIARIQERIDLVRRMARRPRVSGLHLLWRDERVS